MRTHRYRFIPGILWFIISTVLLTLPGSAFPKENWLEKIWFDKWVHIGMFGIMVFTWCWGISKMNIVNERKQRLYLWVLVTAIAYGILIEFIQLYFIPNRSFDVGDIAADAIGATLGFLIIRRYIKK